MEIALIVFFLLVTVGAVVAGKDSRIDEVSRRRHYLG
jgi:hypothetical protein